ESPYSKDILITDRVYEVINNIALEEGYFSIQDTSSALVVRLLDPNPEESILDLFAGPGGKATYIAEIMHNTGEIIAVDKFPEKIKKIKKAMEILQIKNIKTVVKDALQYGPIAPAFDKVLLDVPCSGWGVFQKKAELRWQKNQNMNELLKLQENALKYSSSFVKSGGFLIYSTCTLNHRENEEQVMNFLKRNQEFTLVPPDNTQKNFITEGGFLKTIPFKHNMDGAFAAKMQKS
ncbi:MAG: methyltransferase domain-containing protein, partial [Candidatus Cloacimonetes bacterium]|nr:methyltransferase domain-containing protein [Candidatus Cloacimonadota bacterium]